MQVQGKSREEAEKIPRYLYFWIENIFIK